MGLNQNLEFAFIQLVLLSYLIAISASTDVPGIGSRNILQARKTCPINFETKNYSVITNQCRGPPYPQKECCDAFKEFACPFADEINDLSNNCAATMFSYIDLAGKYPPGLFANACRDQEVKGGLTCDALSPSPSPSPAYSGGISIATLPNPSPLLVLAVAFVGLLSGLV